MRPRMHPSRDESAGEPAARHRPVNRLFPASAGDAEPRLQPRLVRRRVPWFAVLTMLLVPARSARTQAIGQGFELERVGQYGQAASIYFATLRADPTNLSALLGLERVLRPLNRLAELLPAAQRAAASSPNNAGLRAVLLRTYVTLNEPDSVRAVALRWAVDAPHDEAPYREWAMALESAHRPDAARDVLLLGRHAVGRPTAFGVELAELAQRAGDWESAAREWAAALAEAPAQLPNAASELRRFADLAGARAAPDARRVRALALARWADMMPDPLAARARAEAARAFIEAGDRSGARDVLERVAGDTAAPPDAQALAQTAIIEALIAGGQLDDAAKRLETEGRLAAEDRAALRLKLARARITKGELDLADAALARDSSVDALALRGWVALYRGRLKDAGELFRAAGPYAGDRRDATDRSAMLALLQQIPLDSFPELGRSLLTLAHGDSLRAVEALRLAASRLAPGPGGRGRPDLLLLAGRVAVRLDTMQQRIALALFDEIIRTAGQGAAAPAAELEWARLLERRAQAAEAIAHLEHLILTYPGSAVVPEARRELERAKGAIPKS